MKNDHPIQKKGSKRVNHQVDSFTFFQFQNCWNPNHNFNTQTSLFLRKTLRFGSKRSFFQFPLNSWFHKRQSSPHHRLQLIFLR